MAERQDPPEVAEKSPDARCFDHRRLKTTIYTIGKREDAHCLMQACILAFNTFDAQRELDEFPAGPKFRSQSDRAAERQSGRAPEHSDDEESYASEDLEEMLKEFAIAEEEELNSDCDPLDNILLGRSCGTCSPTSNNHLHSPEKPRKRSKMRRLAVLATSKESKYNSTMQSITDCPQSTKRVLDEGRRGKKPILERFISIANIGPSDMPKILDIARTTSCGHAFHASYAGYGSARVIFYFITPSNVRNVLRRDKSTGGNAQNMFQLELFNLMLVSLILNVSVRTAVLCVKNNIPQMTIIFLLTKDFKPFSFSVATCIQEKEIAPLLASCELHFGQNYKYSSLLFAVHVKQQYRLQFKKLHDLYLNGYFAIFYRSKSQHMQNLELEIPSGPNSVSTVAATKKLFTSARQNQIQIRFTKFYMKPNEKSAGFPFCFTSPLYRQTQSCGEICNVPSQSEQIKDFKKRDYPIFCNATIHYENTHKCINLALFVQERRILVTNERTELESNI
ncbi:hypothetical protein WN51_07508 [Melipona quadrifasciata]|uniref:Uncharacterized protein n=1 Tax=Melipona quadrifasciata TaxID=166423 RepID=A0A0M9A782_9HYME|nr:hypothetical protein WN51_07508 [Melipona quadrifasciata]